MSIQALLISVAVTLVTVGITFFYFRNRMNKTEKKVDLMFQLIQEHERNSRMAQQMQTMNNNNENLINISDDDDDKEYDSDDSEVVSDNEDEENKLTIQNVEDNLADTVKTISLSLEGAETTQESTLDNNDIDELDELDQVELSDVDSTVVTIDTNEVKDEKSDDGTLNNFVVTKKMNTGSDVESLNEQLSSDSNEDEDNEEEQQNVDGDENVEEVVTQEVKTVVPSINYSKLSKAQLKQLAQDKGLAGYNKLTKGGLVDLLNASP
jgi:hypothetical protein